MYLLQEQENVIVSVRNTICLNTCSNGMTIEATITPIFAGTQICLNPCSNGMTIEESYYL